MFPAGKKRATPYADSSMAEKLTPMMQQYRKIQDEIPSGALLLFRLGDFYEMFFDDARIASDILGLTLTKRRRRE